MRLPVRTDYARSLSDRRGFTLIEVMVSVTILTLILTAAFSAWMSAADFFSHETAVADTSISSRNSLEYFIDGNLYGARLAIGATIGPNPGATGKFTSSERVAFSTNNGFDVATSTVIQAGPVFYYFDYTATEPNDGVDNNGNGVIDEGRIIMQTPNEKITLPGMIAEGGFRVTWDPDLNTMVISITTVRMSRKGVEVQDTARTTIAIRN